MKWKSPLKQINLEKCFILNFGSIQKIGGVAMISVELDKDIELTEHYNRDNDNCFLVLIGNKYVPDIKQVLQKVDIISREIELLPLGIFITNQYDKLSNQFKMNATFPLVKFLKIIFFQKFILQCFCRYIIHLMFILAPRTLKVVVFICSAQASTTLILSNY